MVTYMDPQTVPTYMSVTFMRRTLRITNFTHAPHTKLSLSNIPKLDSIFGEPTHSRGTNRLGQIFPLPPKIKIPNLHIAQFTCQFEQYLSHRQNECHAHPVGANHELLEVYSKPKTGPLPRLLGSYLSGLSAHNFTK